MSTPAKPVPIPVEGLSSLTAEEQQQVEEIRHAHERIDIDAITDGGVDSDSFLAAHHERGDLLAIIDRLSRHPVPVEQGPLTVEYRDWASITEEVLIAHRQRGGWWMCHQIGGGVGGRGITMIGQISHVPGDGATLELCYRASWFADLPMEQARFRPCLPDGTPVCWPGESANLGPLTGWREVTADEPPEGYRPVLALVRGYLWPRVVRRVRDGLGWVEPGSLRSHETAEIEAWMPLPTRGEPTKREVDRAAEQEEGPDPDCIQCDGRGWILDQGAAETCADCDPERLTVTRGEGARLKGEIDRLRAAIEGAPHAQDCPHYGYIRPSLHNLPPCDCWKATALNGKGG